VTRKKKPLDRNEPVAPVNSGNDTSEEFSNFENALRQIMTMPESEAKRIRDKYSPKGRKRKKPKS
jgi:hypothetical protein